MKSITINAALVETLDIFDNPKLESLLGPGARLADISGTNLPFSSLWCQHWGVDRFVASRLVADWSSSVPALLSQCWTHVDVLDLSGNIWMEQLVAIEGIVNNMFVFDPLDQYAGFRLQVHGQEVETTSTFTTLFLRGLAVSCSLRKSLEPIHLIRPGRDGEVEDDENVVYHLWCTCGPAYVPVDGHCTLKHSWLQRPLGILAVIMASSAGFGAMLWLCYLARRELKRLWQELRGMIEGMAAAQDRVHVLEQIWAIDWNEIHIISKVGEGGKSSAGIGCDPCLVCPSLSLPDAVHGHVAFGEVYKATWQGRDVAIKVLKVRNYGMGNA